jgi:hypothetical protein
MLRLSIGIEDEADLLADLDRALLAAASAGEPLDASAPAALDPIGHIA